MHERVESTKSRQFPSGNRTQKLGESKKIKEGEVVEMTVRKVKKGRVRRLQSTKPFKAEDELDTHD